MNGDRRLVIHAAAVVADAAHDIDRHRRVDADGDGVVAARIEDAELPVVVARGDGVQGLVEVAKGGRGEVVGWHRVALR
jgi:hypothetical protein